MNFDTDEIAKIIGMKELLIIDLQRQIMALNEELAALKNQGTSG